MQTDVKGLMSVLTDLGIRDYSAVEKQVATRKKIGADLCTE